MDKAGSVCVSVKAMSVSFSIPFSFSSERFPNEDVPCGLKLLWMSHVGLDTMR